VITPVFLPPAVLRTRYAALGAETANPIVYCGSGVTACHDLLALRVAGLVPPRAKAAKVIKSGALTKAVKLSGIGVTKGAKAAIEAAGGSVA